MKQIGAKRASDQRGLSNAEVYDGRPRDPKH